jgi:hypothetical protein
VGNPFTPHCAKSKTDLEPLHSFLLEDFMRTFKSIVFSFALIATLVQSTPAKAAVGAIFAPGLVVVGLVMTVGGVATTPLILRCGGHGACGGKADKALAYVGLIGAITGFLGIVVLDGEQTLEFTEISFVEAKKKRITVAEMNSYNSEVDMINALSAHVDAELAKIDKPSKEDSALLWQSVSEELNPRTLSALKKLL